MLCNVLPGGKDDQWRRFFPRLRAGMGVVNTRCSWLLLVFLLVISCAKNRQTTWPARVANLQGFSQSEATEVAASLQKLNDLAETIVIEPSGEMNGGYPIYFELASPDYAETKRVGHARFSNSECTVTLAPDLFLPESETYVANQNGSRALTAANAMLNAVVFHEVGHCAGMKHSFKKEALMYPVTGPLYEYSQTDLRDFIAELLILTDL